MRKTIASDGPHLHRGLRTGALVLAGLSAIAAVPAHVLTILAETTELGGTLATSGLLFTLVGGLVVVRQPQHRLGPLLVVIGTLGTVGGLAEAVTAARFGPAGMSLPGVVWAAWFGDWYWVALLWLPLVALPLLFPDGRLPSPRWRWFAGAALLVGVVQVGAALGSQQLLLDGVQLGTGSRPGPALWLDNPVGFLPLRNFEADLNDTLPLVALFVVPASWALLGRLRGADDVERRQVKVAIAGVVLSALGFVVLGALDAVFDRRGELVVVDFLLSLVIPVALGVAILRHRLYDIDRVLSRTVAWFLVSAVLVAVYLSGVVLLQSLLQPVVGEGDLPVALATLVGAAIARPLLRRVQRLVDRRFNRAHYDATRTVDAFGRGLRDEVSREAIVADLEEVTRRALQPRAVGVHTVGRAERGGMR